MVPLEQGPSWNSAKVEQAFAVAGATVRRVDRLRVEVEGRRWWEVRSPDTTDAAVQTCRNKASTSAALQAAGVAVPEQVRCRPREAAKVAERLGWPVCVKPVQGSQGRAVTPQVTNRGLLQWAVTRASGRGRLPVLVERSVEGTHWRVLVIGTAVSLVECRPFRLTGDGKAAVDELVARENTRRRTTLTQPFLIKLDEGLVRTLAEQRLRPMSVPTRGRVVELSWSRNVHQGAEPVERGEGAPERVRVAAEAAVAAVDGLAHAAVDLVDDGATCWVVDVNSNPGLASHLHPYEGEPRPVLEPLVARYFQVA